MMMMALMDDCNVKSSLKTDLSSLTSDQRKEVALGDKCPNAAKALVGACAATGDFTDASFVDHDYIKCKKNGGGMSDLLPLMMMGGGMGGAAGGAAAGGMDPMMMMLM